MVKGKLSKEFRFKGKKRKNKLKRKRNKIEICVIPRFGHGKHEIAFGRK